jgi:hypothetical protein
MCSNNLELFVAFNVFNCHKIMASKDLDNLGSKSSSLKIVAGFQASQESNYNFVFDAVAEDLGWLHWFAWSRKPLMDLQVGKFSLGHLDAKSFFQNLSWKASHDGKNRSSFLVALELSEKIGMEISHQLSCLLDLLISLIVHRLGQCLMMLLHPCWLGTMQNMGHLSSCCGSPLSQSWQHHWSFHASLLQRRLNMIRHPDVAGSGACLWLLERKRYSSFLFNSGKCDPLT